MKCPDCGGKKYRRNSLDRDFEEHRRAGLTYDAEPPSGPHDNYYDEIALRNYATRHYFDEGVSSRKVRAKAPSIKPGAWQIDSGHKWEHGREIEQLGVFNPKDLIPSEFSWEDPEEQLRYQGRLIDAKRYAEWIEDGYEPPPISVVQHVDGHFSVSNGHRRLYAAYLARKPIKAWVSWVADYQGSPVGLTHEIAETHGLPQGVKHDGDYTGKKRRRNPDLHLRELERQLAGGDEAVIAPLVRAYLRQGRTPDLDADGLALLRRHGGDELLLDYLMARVREEPANGDRWQALVVLSGEAGLRVVVPGYRLRSDWIARGSFSRREQIPPIAHLVLGSRPFAMVVGSWPREYEMTVRYEEMQVEEIVRDIPLALYGYLIARRVRPSAPINEEGDYYLQMVGWESIPPLPPETGINYQMGAAALMEDAAQNIKLINSSDLGEVDQ